MKSYILAIDQGTTSSRAILFDRQSNVIAIAQEEITQLFRYPGWVEEDANEIWLKTLAVIAKVLTMSEVHPSDIAAIGITNQRETTVVWDKHTGIPLHDAVVWQSRQSDEICQHWTANGWKDKIQSKTGLPIDPYFSASKLKWILNQYPHANADDLLFGTIDTWLLWKLTAGKTHATDVSNASRTMMYNIHEMKWDDELLAMFELPKSILPEVRDSSCLFANTEKSLFFNQEVPITSLIGDQQAALFGQCCFEKGMVKNTYGTGGFLLMNTDDQIIDSKYGLVSTVAWRIKGKVQYALEGSIFISGSLIKWLRDGLNIIEDAKQTEAIANSVDSSNGVYIVPAFVGLGTPYWDDQCSASILGLTQGVTKKHIVRAALEAMCYQSKDVLDAMIKDAQVNVHLLRVDGGASKNKFLLQFQSDVLNIPVENLVSQETTALGAAYLAGIEVGFYQMDALKAKQEDQFVPCVDQACMHDLYEGWKNAVSATRSFKGK